MENITLGDLSEHWPFVAWLICSILIGQVVKATLWTKGHADTSKPRWFWWWAYKTMAIHPMAVGIIIGIFWTNPEEHVNGRAFSIAYFAMAGGLSTWAYEALKGLAKKKGIDLSLPGIPPSDPPPPAVVSNPTP
jgi:hypothetical protein